MLLDPRTLAFDIDRPDPVEYRTERLSNCAETSGIIADAWALNPLVIPDVRRF